MMMPNHNIEAAREKAERRAADTTLSDELRAAYAAIAQSYTIVAAAEELRRAARVVTNRHEQIERAAQKEARGGE